MLQSLKSQIDSSVDSMRRLLQRPIKLDEGSIKLGTPEAKLRQQEREAKRQRVRQMRRDLYELLDQHPASRNLMRHLALVERTLQQQGLQGFEALPHAVIVKALSELERLVWDWSPTGLADLRSRMAVLAKNRPTQAQAAVHAAAAVDESVDARSAISGGSGTAEVTEVDHAEFEEMERSWSGVMPQQAASAQAATA